MTDAHLLVDKLTGQIGLIDYEEKKIHFAPGNIRCVDGVTQLHGEHCECQVGTVPLNDTVSHNCDPFLVVGRN